MNQILFKFYVWVSLNDILIKLCLYGEIDIFKSQYFFNLYQKILFFSKDPKLNLE